MRHRVLSDNKKSLGILVSTVLFCACFTGACHSSSPPQASLSPTPKSAQLGRDSSWVYQLQSIDLETLRASSSSVVVIDPSLGGQGDKAGFWSKEDIESLRESGKIVLAYLSVGEAETYRDYWREDWLQTPPDFIVRPNITDGYPDNFLVKYWDERWKELVISRLHQVMDLGFDGVYLDKVDAFDDWLTVENHPKAQFLEDEMASLILTIEEEGNRLQVSSERKFQLFLQNAWKLWSRSDIAAKIDGVGIEEFSLGWEGKDGRATPEEVKSEIEKALEGSKDRDWVVLIVDYPGADSTSKAKQHAIVEAQRLGALSTQAPRELDGAL